jgi:hypothetical protein
MAFALGRKKGQKKVWLSTQTQTVDRKFFFRIWEKMPDFISPRKKKALESRTELFFKEKAWMHKYTHTQPHIFISSPDLH